jgi:hypothetical protein
MNTISIDRVQALFSLIFFYEVAEYIQLHYPTNTWFPSDGLEAFLWVMELFLAWFILSKIPPNPPRVVRFAGWAEKNRLVQRIDRK